MSNSYLIRGARRDECTLLTDLALRSKASWGYSDAFMEQCTAELTIAPSDIDSDQYFVLECDGEVIGFCALLGADAREGELAHVFIEPAHQREGHGLRLVEHAKSVARSRGWQRLRVESDPNAGAFYRSCGGTEIGTVPSGSIAGRSLPLFEIPL